MDVFGQPGFDLLIVQKLGENCELFSKELVGEVHSSVHDSSAVGSNRVGYVTDVDRVEVLVVALVLDEDLVVEVVHVLGHENMDVPHDFKHVQSLIKRKLDTKKCKVVIKT